MTQANKIPPSLNFESKTDYKVERFSPTLTSKIRLERKCWQKSNTLAFYAIDKKQKKSFIRLARDHEVLRKL
jgi:hypothetical protein